MAETRVSKNLVVSITYRIFNEKGELAEQSDLPIDYIHGVENPMFEKIEHALDQKCVGDTVEVELSPTEGFGEYNPNLCFTDDLENVPHEYRFVGARPSFENEQGEVMDLVVTKIENGKLTVDANHQFAGQTVKFQVDVVGIRPATKEELDGTAIVSQAPHTLQ
ncbi:MAG: peptidylprolyl isomerase [Gammaproteobacteria bacterium]|nr:peptidylprolyl isomerase [Gammaproteobacteria bacterium]MDH5802936.1 peptidylprolyl isomerase [Gammaproteobacteria bacterium]